MRSGLLPHSEGGGGICGGTYRSFRRGVCYRRHRLSDRHRNQVGAALLVQPPILNANHAAGGGGNLRVVRNNQHGTAGGVNALQNLNNLGAVVAVQVTGGLVSKNQRRARGEGTSNGAPLLLTAGEVAGADAGAVAQPQKLEGFFGALQALAVGYALHAQTHGGVGRAGFVQQHVRGLEDEAEVVSAHFVAFSVAESFRVFAEEAVGSAGGRVEQANGVEQGGFTGARRTNNGEEFAAFYHQVEVVENGPVATLEDAGNATHFDSGCGTNPSGRCSGGRYVGCGCRRPSRAFVGGYLSAAHETSTFCPALRFALMAAYPPAVRRTSTLTRSVAGASLLVEVELPPFSTST